MNQQEENQRVLNLLAEHYQKGYSECKEDVRKLIDKFAIKNRNLGMNLVSPTELKEQINKMEHLNTIKDINDSQHSQDKPITYHSREVADKIGNLAKPHLEASNSEEIKNILRKLFSSLDYSLKDLREICIQEGKKQGYSECKEDVNELIDDNLNQIRKSKNKIITEIDLAQDSSMIVILEGLKQQINKLEKEK